MGICATYFNVIPNNLNINPNNKFIKYNLIDSEYKIAVGIYSTNNINEYTKSNTMINQGIYIGHNNPSINKIKFGIIHKYGNKKVELYFENNIILSLESVDDENKKNKIRMILFFNGKRIEKYANNNILQKFIPINDDSEYIDLIAELVN